jgi:hypothetical protein
MMTFDPAAKRFKEARMRGDDQQQAAMWSYISPEQRVPADHPLRLLRTMVDEAMACRRSSPNCTRRWAGHRLRRRRCSAVWDATVFTKNRQRLLEGHCAGLL